MSTKRQREPLAVKDGEAGVILMIGALWVVAAALIAIGLYTLVLYWKTFRGSSLSGNPSDWGDFAAVLGAAVSPVIGLLAAAVILIQLRDTKQAVALQAKQLELQREQLDRYVQEQRALYRPVVRVDYAIRRDAHCPLLVLKSIGPPVTWLSWRGQLEDVRTAVGVDDEDLDAGKIYLGCSVSTPRKGTSVYRTIADFQQSNGVIGVLDLEYTESRDLGRASTWTFHYDGPFLD